MKKQLLFVWLFLFCAAGKAQITINTAQIEAFHNLMQYIEQKAGRTLSCECLEGVDLQAVFDKNSQDSTLNVLIENLLNSSPYYLPERLRFVGVWLTDDGEATAQGKHAYRIAFTILPDFCVRISGRMSETWIQYWNHEDRNQVDNSIGELKANQKEIIKNAKPGIKALLPDDVDMNAEINIHIITAGNAGDHMFGNDIMMDMIWWVLYESFDISRFTKVLKHEIHHVFYIPWLAERFGNKERNLGERLLWRYQESFILEGVASFFDFPLSSPEGKQMFANRELIAELFDEWTTVIRGLMGDSPRKYFSIFQNEWGPVSVERLKRFWPGDPDSIVFAGRPTVTYSVSHNIYLSILESGGHEKLKFVIENPAKLLSVFNELHTECMIVPRVPDDIVVLWKNNLTP